MAAGSSCELAGEDRDRRRPVEPPRLDADADPLDVADQRPAARTEDRRPLRPCRRPRDRPPGGSSGCIAVSLHSTRHPRPRRRRAVTLAVPGHLADVAERQGRGDVRRPVPGRPSPPVHAPRSTTSAAPSHRGPNRDTSGSTVVQRRRVDGEATGGHRCHQSSQVAANNLGAGLGPRLVVIRTPQQERDEAAPAAIATSTSTPAKGVRQVQVRLPGLLEVVAHPGYDTSNRGRHR